MRHSRNWVRELRPNKKNVIDKMQTEAGFLESRVKEILLRKPMNRFA